MSGITEQYKDLLAVQRKIRKLKSDTEKQEIRIDEIRKKILDMWPIGAEGGVVMVGSKKGLIQHASTFREIEVFK